MKMMKLLISLVILGLGSCEMNSVTHWEPYHFAFDMNANATNPYFKDNGAPYKYNSGTCGFPLNITGCNTIISASTGSIGGDEKTVIGIVSFDEYDIKFGYWEMDEDQSTISRDGDYGLCVENDAWAFVYMCTVNPDTACNTPAKVEEKMSMGYRPLFCPTYHETACYIGQDIDPFVDGLPYSDLMRCAQNGTLQDGSGSVLDYTSAFGMIVYDDFTGFVSGQELHYDDDYANNLMTAAILCEWIIRQEVNGIYFYGFIPNNALPGYFDYYDWPFHIPKYAWTNDDCEYWVGTSNPWFKSGAEMFKYSTFAVAFILVLAQI